MGEIPCATDSPWVRGLAAGDGLLVAAGRRGLDVLAPSSTAAFERIGQLRPAGLTWEDVEVRDRLAFAVSSNATDGDKVMLGVVGLADPRQPVLRAAVSFGRRPPLALALSGDLALIAAGDDGLNVVDVADPDLRDSRGATTRRGRSTSWWRVRGFSLPTPGSDCSSST